MARRMAEEELPAMEAKPEERAPAVERAPRRPARTAKKEDASPKRPRLVQVLYWTIPIFALAAAFLAVAAFHRVESFLINDQRFHLEGSAEYGRTPEHLNIAGLKRASESEILRVFESDFGRSLYLLSVNERRQAILAVDWVKDATVSRRWPNQLYVRIVEREPVAVAQVNVRNAAPAFQMIDIDGVLLPIPRGEKVDKYPVLTGFGTNEAKATRKMRVEHAAAMLQELGSMRSMLAEIDVRDPGNLQATLQVEANAVTLRMGNRNYRKRLQNFLKHQERIRLERPEARTFDLRIDGRITAVEGETHGD
ncbi:MAG: FtsQ-type POTRA domain-containing protein [Bryobacterales bacterium]|nr:FtsQ-type POTRA domain-containing protein [Bryobacterales bacterium]